MRGLLFIAALVLAGCATAGREAPPLAGDSMLLQSGRTTRTTSGSRTQTVGLPLSRGAKIGLWAGVAVVLAYLMATDGEEEAADSADP